MLVNSSSSSPPPGEQHARSPSGQRRYKGVRRRKWGRWVSEIRLPNSRERIWLGSYDTPEKAARAFDTAFVCLRGPGAADGLNFPDSPPAVSRTSDVQEVYAAAVSHANRTATATREEATDPTPVHDDVPMESLAVAAMPTRLEVEKFDWSQLMANPPPLFSPTVVASHAHLPVSPTGVDMEEDESGAYPGLWSFDSDGSCSRH